MKEDDNSPQSDMRRVLATLWNYMPDRFSGFAYFIRDWYEMKNIRYNSYLRSEGWVASQRESIPIRPNGDPIPWYTYPTIDFLDARIGDNITVFEYGSGFSTMWYASRVRKVTGVEHDGEWVEKVRPQLSESGNIIHRDEREAYIEEALNHAPNDIVVIDGQYRDKCVGPAIKSLSSDGVIVLDDFGLLMSEGEYKYEEEQFEDLLGGDFKQLLFYGPKPLISYKGCTAIFYRKDNCLGI